jgi:hypothetical protein
MSLSDRDREIVRETVREMFKQFGQHDPKTAQANAIFTTRLREATESGVARGIAASAVLFVMALFGLVVAGVRAKIGGP